MVPDVHYKQQVYYFDVEQIFLQKLMTAGK